MRMEFNNMNSKVNQNGLNQASQASNYKNALAAFQMQNSKYEGQGQFNISQAGVLLSKSEKIERQAQASHSNNYDPKGDYELSKEEAYAGQVKTKAIGEQIGQKAVFMKMQVEDLVKMDENDVNLGDLDYEKSDKANIVEKIQIGLAAHDPSFKLGLTNISQDKIEAELGSKRLAREVRSQAVMNGISLKESDIDKVTGAVNQAELVMSDVNFTQDAKRYLVSQNLPLTIKNLSIAEAGITALPYEDGQTYSELPDSIRPQVEKNIEDAGLEADQKNLDIALDFLNHDLAISPENLSYMNKLDSVNYDQEQVIKKILFSFKEGKSVYDSDLMADTQTMDQDASVIKALRTSQLMVTSDKIEASDMAFKSYKDAVSLNNIVEAIDAYDTGRDYSKIVTDKGLDQNKETKISLDQFHTMLYNVSAMMSADSALALSYKLDINEISLFTLHDNLLAYDQEKTFEEIGLALAHDIDSGAPSHSSAADSLEMLGGSSELDGQLASGLALEVYQSYQLSVEFRASLVEVTDMPLETLGQLGDVETVSLNSILDRGRSIRSQYQNRRERYEAIQFGNIGDADNKLYGKSAIEDFLEGDSFLSSLADRVKELGFEKSQDNLEAAKILSKSGIDLTEKNLSLVRDIKSCLDSIVDNMNPTLAMQLIRDGVNPMDSDIHDVRDYLLENEDKALSKDKYSRFLAKMDSAGSILKEERQTYIGIYKMMNVFKNDASTAIGALLKNHSELTMKNLMISYKASRSGSLDVRLDDKLSVKEAADQSYYMNLFSETGSKLSPASFREAELERTVDDYQIEEFCDKINSSYDPAKEAQYLDNYLKIVDRITKADRELIEDLENSGSKISINNVDAYERLAQGSAFETLFGQSDYKALDFLDAMDAADPEAALQNLYDKIANELEDEYKTDDQVYEADNLEEFRDINSLDKAFSFAKNLSQKHVYQLPYDISQDKVGVMKLTIEENKESKKVLDHMNIGLTHASFGHIKLSMTLDDGKLDVYADSDNHLPALNEALDVMADRVAENSGLDKVQIHKGRYSQLTSRIMEEEKEGDLASMIKIARQMVLELSKL